MIAGAGISGLSTAMALARKGFVVRVVDPRGEAGGLAATRMRGKLPYKSGIHLLHPSNSKNLGLVEEMVGLMGPAARAVRPLATVHFLGRYLSYPFNIEELVRTLGTLQAMNIAADALRTRTFSRRKSLAWEMESFEDVVIQGFGETFYRMFFKDYTRKVLGIEPSQVDGEWARRRVPMPTTRALLRVLTGWSRIRVEHAHSPFDTCQYQSRYGVESLISGLIAACGNSIRLELGSAVTRVYIEGNRLRGVELRRDDGTFEVCHDVPLISTMPVTELLRLFEPPPPQHIQEAASQLRFRGIIFVFVVLRMQRLLQSHWTYFQSPAFVFNRVSEVGNLNPAAYGRNRTVVCAEVTADTGDPSWYSADCTFIGDTISGLEEATRVRLNGLVEETFVHREPFAYPLWTLGFRRPLETVMDWLDNIEGLFVTGRQGRFEYLNMDECIAEGLATGDRVLSKMR